MAEQTCTTCGAVNPEGQKFCGACGSALTAICINGHQNPPGQRFCGECGEPLGASGVATPRADDAGERRLVTALFADLVGFTPFAETRDPEEVRAMLTRYFDRSRVVIERFGGEVDKYIGDAVTAFWGARQALEDDAERAVRAGLELIDTVTELGEEIGVPDLALRVGVLSGETSVGAGGNERGLVVGDIVNTAARLQAAAAPRSVLVGEATRALTEGAIRYEPVGEHDLKGKSVPVAAFRAVDVAAEVGGRGRFEGLEAPFVGREDELRLLKDQIHATTREQRARLVSIVGEAGIGKSRLAWEMQKYLDGLTEVFRWHQGRSPAYGDGVTFWALGEMVKHRAKIAETDEPLKQRTKLRTTVAEYVTDPDEQRWIEPRLAGLLGLDEMPAGDRNELFAALRTFFQRVAETGTAILVFEDLHWADSGLLDFIEELVEWSPRHPILIVTLARPDLLADHPQWGTGRRHFLALHLGPLPDGEMAELVEGLAPGIPDDVVSLIVGKAEGVPLYAVEFVRMLVGTGDLVRKGDRFAMTGTIAELAIPDSLRSVIAARLDRLEPDLRALVLDASVLGYGFTEQGLGIFGDRPDLSERLRELVHHELLELDTDERSPERGQYRFIQGVIREVAYDRIALSDRRDRHIAVAEYYRGFDDVEYSAVIASHYVDALAADPSSAEVAAATRDALQQAAERAAELRSHQQVLDLANRAIELTADEAAAVDLHVLAAQAALDLAEIDDAIDHASTALEWYRANDRPAEAMATAALVGKIHTDALHPAQAVEALLPFYDTRSDMPEQAALAAALGRAYFLNDRSEEGLPVLEHALKLAEAHRDTATLADAIVTKGSMLPEFGRPQEGLLTLSGAVDFAERHDLGYVAGRAINNLLVLTELDGNLPVGELTERGLVIARRAGEANNLLRLLAQRGYWLVQMYRFDEAQEVLDQADFAYTLEEIVTYLNLTQAYKNWLTTGDGDARAAYERAAGAYEYAEEPQMIDSGLDALARMKLYTGDLEGALAQALEVGMRGPWVASAETALTAALLLGEHDAFERAAEYATTTWPYGGRKQDSHRMFVAAGQAFVDGDTAQAVAAFTDLISLYQEAFTNDYLQNGRLLFASLLGTEAPEARAAAEIAARELTDAGAFAILDMWKGALPPPVVEAAG